MSDEFRAVLDQIKQAYVQLQADGVRPTLWKREGASSYTVQAPPPKAATSPEAPSAAPAPLTAEEAK